MNQNKYRQLSATLEDRIHNGEFDYTIPSTRSLAFEYGVSKQTVTNALKPLIESGLLKSGRRRGMYINYSRKSQGLIGTVYYGRIDGVPEDTWLGPGLKQMKSDGYETVLINMPQRRLTPYISKLFSNNFAGLIFIHSTLTEEIAVYLDRKNVPFISCNKQPINSSVNYVEYDHEYIFDKILGGLKEKGYRYPALFFYSQLDGFCDMIQRCWRSRKQKHDLTWEKFDHFIAGSLSNWDVASSRYLDFLAKCPTLPDAVVYWGTMGASKEFYTLANSKLPNEILWLHIKNQSSDPPGNFIGLEEFDSSPLYLEAYRLLRQLILVPDSHPIHGKITSEPVFKHAIPTKSSLRKKMSKITLEKLAELS